MPRLNPPVDRVCQDCGASFKGHKIGRSSPRCQACRDLHKRLYKQGLEKKSGPPRSLPIPRNLPPLLHNYPVLSRGWFRENLANGHTAQSLADLTGLQIERIKLEMPFVRLERVA